MRGSFLFGFIASMHQKQFHYVMKKWRDVTAWGFLNGTFMALRGIIKLHHWFGILFLIIIQ